MSFAGTRLGSYDLSQSEVFVQPFPPTGAKWQVSVNGGVDPTWRDGELLFADRDRMIQAVPVTTTGTSFVIGRATPVFRIPSRGGVGTAGFDVSPDGKRFLVRVVTPAAPQPLSILLNWQARLQP